MPQLWESLSTQGLGKSVLWPGTEGLVDETGRLPVGKMAPVQGLGLGRGQQSSKGLRRGSREGGPTTQSPLAGRWGGGNSASPEAWGSNPVAVLPLLSSSPWERPLCPRGHPGVPPVDKLLCV